jgi:hypothetical protein
MPSTLRVFSVSAPAEATKAELLAVMEWHVFSEAQLAGLYTPQP